MESSDEIHLRWPDFNKWITHAQNEVIQRFNLKPPEGYPNYPSYCFVKKNTNRYFRKHLGFTFCYNFYKENHDRSIITILDRKKLMIFRLKYGL
jgi:hypothetical protein